MLQIRKLAHYPCILLLIGLTASIPAGAQFPFPIPNPQKLIRDMVAKSLGADAPLKLDQATSFTEVSPPNNFKPRKLATIYDLDRPLASGDYAVDAMFYCTEYSIHRPAQGIPYKLASTQGRLVKPLCALLNRGTLQGIDPAVLNVSAWRIEAGVPLSQWPSSDQAMAHKLIPDYEDKLQGDYIQQVRHKYDTSIKLFTRKSFDDMLGDLGDLGQQVQQIEKARQVLCNQAISDDQMPDLLYQQTGDGGDPVLASDSDHPSPWMQIRPGVIGRYTIVGGYLQKNLFEFRVTPDAAIVSTAPRPQAFATQAISASDTKPNANQNPTLAQVMGMDESDWSNDPPDLIGYPVGQGSQDPIVTPILPKVSIIDLQLDKPDVAVGQPITGTATAMDSDGKPIPQASVWLTFTEKSTDTANATDSDSNDKNLGSTITSGDKNTFSFQTNDVPGTVKITASIGGVSSGASTSSADINSFSIISSANAADTDTSSPLTVTKNVTVFAPECSIKPLTPLTDPMSIRFENGQNLDLDDLSPAMKTATALFRQKISVAGGHLIITSAYRPPQYQVHLQEVWDKWKLLKKSEEPECQAMKSTIKTEIDKHHLHKQRPAGFSGPHTKGLAIDIDPMLSGLPKGLTFQQIVAIAKQCGLHLRSDLPNDPYHFEHD